MILVFLLGLTSLPFGKVATDKCIMLFLFLIVCGVIAIIVVKVNSAVYFDLHNLERRVPDDGTVITWKKEAMFWKCIQILCLLY